MSMSNYWVAQWLEENEIRKEKDILNVLDSTGGIEGLKNKANEARDKIRNKRAIQPSESELANSIVAGRRVDLSGILACPTYGCLRRNIDTIFKNIWHYFDNVVVEGISPETWFRNFCKGDENVGGSMLRQVHEQARLLLYLRSIGADKYIVVANKTFSFCQEHWMEHAKNLGIADAFDENNRAKLIKQIVDSSSFDVENRAKGVWSAKVRGPLFDESKFYIIVRENPPSPELIVSNAVNDLATATISDVELSRRLSLPLVEATMFPAVQSVSKSSKPENHDGGHLPSAADVALNLELPVFDRLSTRDLLKMREDERPDFEAFRSALRAHIQSRLASADEGATASSIARSIDEEYLRPGLAEIERKLRTSRQAVVRKTVVDLTIGATAVGVAALSSVPMMIAGGVAALGSSVPLAPVIHSYIDDKRSARMSDLYFLWRVGQHAKH
jgi:hypothetical protein